MCGGGGGNQVQSVSTTNLDPEIKKRYLALLDRGEDVADLPYVNYGGQRVAGFTPDQEASFQGIRDAAGSFQSDLDKAREQAGIAAMPMADSVGSFDRAALDRYGDPYSQSVIDATIADIGRTGELARRDLDARAGVGGGIGSYGPSERATLERSEQWRDQSDATARAVAQLRSSNFAQAQGQFNTEQNRGLAAKQNDAARAAAAASQYTGIAGAGQEYGLRGAAALYDAGSAQQGQTQRGLDTAYSDFLEQRGYPKEQAEFLSGIYRGYPTTTSTTTSAPGANPWTQALGLGIAGVGALGSSGAFGSSGWLFRRGGRVRRRMARGGRVRMADGGGVHSGVMRRRMSRGIDAYASGGSVYGGLSNEDLGRLIDAGNMDAYDEYVSRLAGGYGESSDGVGIGARETPDVRPPFLRNERMPSGSRAEFYNGRLSDSTPGEPHYSGSGSTGTDATGRYRPLELSDLGISGAPDIKGRADTGFDLSDLGISGLPSLKVPDWVPDWPGGRDAMAHADETGGGMDPLPPDYVPPPRYRGQPGTRYRGQPPMDGGIADASIPATDSAGPRYPLAPRKPTIGHNGGPPMEDQGISGYDYGDAGVGRRGIMTGGGRGIADADAQALVKQASGASADEEDAPSWAMPLMVMGLSMAASRNPSVLGAIGEGGIGALSTWINQKRDDAAAQLDARKEARDERESADKSEYYRSQAETARMEEERKAREAESAPPETRERNAGSMTIFEEWDPKAKRYKAVSKYPRWKAADGDAGETWEVTDIPGVGKVQRNKRTGKVESLGRGETAESSYRQKVRDLQAAGYNEREAVAIANGIDPLSLPEPTKTASVQAGTAENPLIPESQADIDNAPAGTVIKDPVSGKLFVK